MRSLASFPAVLLFGVSCVAACGGDDAQGCTEPAQCGTDTTMTTGATTDASSSGGGDSSGADGSTTASDATATGSASADGSSSGGVDDGRCDPLMAPFLSDAGALPQASIGLDPAAMTCAAASLSGIAPQLVLDVQDSGLINATGFGIEIQSASSGLVFDDPPMGDSQVIDLTTNLEITLEATLVDGGAAVTIVFTVDSAGPSLAETAVQYH
ncbi:MAG: hypothetical protein IPK74_10475 [Deltaproteobacteria bacterium]|nr:hypothetical protein [Deltaproteobacteria bacterium]